MALVNDIPAGAHVLATRIPEYRCVEGLEYGRHVSAPGWSGYYVRPADSDLPMAIARMDPTAREPDDAIVEAIGAEIDEAKAPVVIVAARPTHLEELETLPGALTLAEAKAAAASAGYRVIDEGEGGLCETTTAWNGRRSHVVTVTEESPTHNSQNPQNPTDPAGRMDALIARARAFDDRPHARIVAMLEGLLTEDQWREVEAMVDRRGRASK